MSTFIVNPKNHVESYGASYNYSPRVQAENYTIEKEGTLIFRTAGAVNATFSADAWGSVVEYVVPPLPKRVPATIEEIRMALNDYVPDLVAVQLNKRLRKRFLVR